MNRDEIVKALECCQTQYDRNCKDCPYQKNKSRTISVVTCESIFRKDCLSLVKKLTEENERLQAEKEMHELCEKDLRFRNKELQNTNEALAKQCEEFEQELISSGRSVGEWTRSDEYTEQYGYLYKCSCCGVLMWHDKYCGNCGAKMKGANNENTLQTENALD